MNGRSHKCVDRLTKWTMNIRLDGGQLKINVHLSTFTYIVLLLLWSDCYNIISGTSGGC